MKTGTCQLSFLLPRMASSFEIIHLWLKVLSECWQQGGSVFAAIIQLSTCTIEPEQHALSVATSAADEKYIGSLENVIFSGTKKNSPVFSLDDSACLMVYAIGFAMVS